MMPAVTVNKVNLHSGSMPRREVDVVVMMAKLR